MFQPFRCNGIGRKIDGSHLVFENQLLHGCFYFTLHRLMVDLRQKLCCINNPGLLHGFQITVAPILIMQKCGFINDGTNSLVTFVQQMIGRFIRSLEVVHHNRVYHYVRKIAINQHQRDIGFIQAQNRFPRFSGRGHDKPIDLTGAQKIQHFYELVVVFVGRAKNDRVISGISLVFYRSGQTGKKRIGNIGYNQTNGM